MHTGGEGSGFSGANFIYTLFAASLCYVSDLDMA